MRETSTTKFPPLHSPDWWTQRQSVMESFSGSMAGLRKFVCERHGVETWRAMVERSRLTQTLALYKPGTEPYEAAKAEYEQLPVPRLIDEPYIAATRRA